MARTFSGARLAAKAALLILCCAVDASVLRPAWTGLQIVDGQIRRGYFEPFQDGVGLALDTVIRPLFPNFLITRDGALGVPPGASAIAPLTPGSAYAVVSDSELAPYVVVGVDAPLTPGRLDPQLLPGEARLADARTVDVRDGRLALVPWNPIRPWREDAQGLAALRQQCDDSGGTASLHVVATEGQLELRLGRCAVVEPFTHDSEETPLFAALAGPDWITVARQPQWVTERWFVWPVLAAVVVRVAAMAWTFGLPSTVAITAVLAGASVYWPVAATLTWAMALALSVVAVLVRVAALILRALPQRWRAPATAGVLALIGYVVIVDARQPREPSTIMRVHADAGQPEACALVGYSTVQGASLRRGIGGIRWFVDEDCAACRQNSAALAAGGETLAWLGQAYCEDTPPGFGADGLVAFLGGANDDFFWGVASLARLFVISQQSIDNWHANQAPATAASLARIDEQIAALDRLMACARVRGARFLFLHDFLVSDLPAGRAPDRAAMLARRRAAVKAAGGTFVDLFHVFGAEAGISWFNDYVHPSLVAHQRIAELLCTAALGSKI